MTTAPLDDAATGQLDGSGAGLVRLGPRRPGQLWRVTGAAIQCDADDPMPRAYLYRGPAVPGNQLANTYTGAQNSTDLPSVVLRFGEVLTAQWLDGLAGATITLSVYGEVETR